MARANPTKEAVEAQISELAQGDAAPVKLELLREAAATCTACALHEEATQTVFGVGPADARLVLVGEQPGDKEDLAGLPFVGPAGRLLDKLLAAAEIPRERVYLTNAVKHFKWSPRGKRRIHGKPTTREITGCTPWLAAELAALKPAALTCLGASAAQALLGRDFRITQRRGELIKDSPWAPTVMATFHPAALLRLPDKETYKLLFEQVRADLLQLRELL